MSNQRMTGVNEPIIGDKPLLIPSETRVCSFNAEAKQLPVMGYRRATKCDSDFNPKDLLGRSVDFEIPDDIESSAEKNVTVNDLPVEMWGHILGFLSIRDLLRMREVSWLFKSIIDKLFDGSDGKKSYNKLKNRVKHSGFWPPSSLQTPSVDVFTSLQAFMVKPSPLESTRCGVHHGNCPVRKEPWMTERAFEAIKGNIQELMKSLKQEDKNKRIQEKRIRKTRSQEELEFKIKLQKVIKGVTVFSKGCIQGTAALLSHYFIYPICEGAVNRIVATNIKTILQYNFLSSFVALLYVDVDYPLTFLLKRKIIYLPEAFKVALWCYAIAAHCLLLWVLVRGAWSKKIALVYYCSFIIISTGFYLIHFNLAMEKKLISYCRSPL